MIVPPERTTEFALANRTRSILEAPPKAFDLCRILRNRFAPPFPGYRSFFVGVFIRSTDIVLYGTQDHPLEHAQEQNFIRARETEIP